MAEQEQGSKKCRLPNACDECRRRKIRCDSATSLNNICSNCITLKTECTHQFQRKKRGHRKIDPARALVNVILSSSKPFVVPEDPETVKKMLFDLANHARSLDRQLSQTRAAVPATETTVSPAMSSHTPEPESIDSLAEELSRVSITHYIKRHVGKSSNLMSIPSAMDSQHDVNRDLKFPTTIFLKHQRPEFWKPFPWQTTPQHTVPPFVFPEEDLLHDLVNIYFTNLNIFFPLLHRPTFERSIAEGLHIQDRSFGATVLALCAIASRQSNDPRNLCEDTTSEHSLGWRWFRQVPLVRESLTEPPSLYDLQFCVLSVFYLRSTSTFEAAWLVAGIGIRSAQEMGIHTQNAHHQNPIENELRKRAFWLLVSLDLFMAAFVGRPRATTPDDFDVDLPIVCDDEYWENENSQKAFVQPEGKPSKLLFFVTFLKLSDIAGHTLDAVRKSELWSRTQGINSRRKAVMELDSALNKFLDTIPDHLKWNPENPDPVFFQQSAILYVIYYSVQIQVHRPFIPRSGQESVLTTCSNAARTTVDILEILHSRQETGMVTVEMIPNVIVLLFDSALILLVNIWRLKRGNLSVSEPAKEMKDVYRCLKLIQYYESRHQTAGRILDILNAVITIGQLPRLTRELKRPRSPGDDDERGLTSASSHTLEDLHDTMHSVRASYSKPDTSLTWNNISTIPQPYSGVGLSPPSSASASYPASSVVRGSGDGMFSNNHIQPQPGAQPAIHTDYIGLPIPFSGDDPQMFVDNLAPAAYRFMLQPGGFPMMPYLMGSTSGLANVDFTQEDCDSVMASVDDIVAGTMEYRAFR